MPKVTIEEDDSSNDKVITFILEGAKLTPHILHYMGIHRGVISVSSKEKNTIMSISCGQEDFYGVAVLAMSVLEDEIHGVEFTTKDSNLVRMFKLFEVKHIT